MQYMHRIYAAHEYYFLMEQDNKERWRACCYLPYYQRPNLTQGEFREIMSGEDDKAFELFQEITKHLSLRAIIVLSAKVSESLKSHYGEDLPKNIHFFDSACPSEWSEAKQKEFRDIAEELATRQADEYIRIWHELLD